MEMGSPKATIRPPQPPQSPSYPSGRSPVGRSGGSNSLFFKEWTSLNLALSEANKYAMHLKEVHEADIFQAMEELASKNSSLAEINRSLRRELEELREGVPQKPSLPNHIDKPIEVPTDPSPEMEDSGAQSMLPPSEDLRISATAPPPGANGITQEDHIDAQLSMNNATVLARTISQAAVLIVREVWCEARVDMLQQCQERLSFMITRRNRKACLQRGTSLSLLRRKAEEKTPWGIMHPVGKARMVWNVLCATAIIWDFFWIPMLVFDLENFKFLSVCEWLLTFFWTFDVCMTFRTGYFVGAKIEMGAMAIAIHYARTWLILDVIIVVLEWIGRLFNVSSSASLLRSTRAARNITSFIKLFRLAKMQHLWSAVQEHVNSNIFELSWTLVLLCITMVAIIHLMACLWYAMGNGADDGWVTYDAYQGKKDTVFWYIASSRWVISQFNGRTDMDDRRNMFERLFTCVMGMLLALIAHALFISIITKTMIDLSEVVSEKTKRRRVVNDYLEAHPMRPALKSQVKRCLYEYKDTTSVAKAEEVVLAILPNYLQTDVLYEVRAPIVMKHSFFHSLGYESAGATRLMCRKVIHILPVSRAEVVFEKGDLCTRMLFTDRLSGNYFDPDDAEDVAQNEGGEHRFKFKSRGRTGTKLFDRQKSSLENNALLEQRSLSYPFLVDTPPNVLQNDWISEPALWTNWKNQGRLIIGQHGVLLGIHANDLGGALKKHPYAFAMASLYAEKFVEQLGCHSRLSDILNFEIVTLSPIYLTVSVIGATGLDGCVEEFDRKSPVHCICRVTGLTSTGEETRFKTETVCDGSDPMWYHTSSLHLSKNQTLVFQVWTETTFIGEARIGPDEFYPDGWAGDRELEGAIGSGYLTCHIEVTEHSTENGTDDGADPV